MHRTLAAAAVLAALGVPAAPRAYGEPVDGFPSWEERVLLEWTNRARCDPQVEMDACGAQCAEGACYEPVPPLEWGDSRAARFHARQLELASPAAPSQTSPCTLVDDTGALYPDTCAGDAACACQAGTFTCSEVCTEPFGCAAACTTYEQRVRLFYGMFASTEGELVGAGSADPVATFYAWLHQASASTACGSSGANADRARLLDGSKYAGGAGMSGTVAVVDFSRPQVVPAVVVARIASGAHYPRRGPSVEAWASWYGTSAATAAVVVVDGACTPMTLERGSATNGAWRAVLAGLETGCHRYYFAMKGTGGEVLTYPSTGSFGVGDDACADFSTERHALGAGCGPVAACEPGPGGCDDGNPCTADTCDPGVGCTNAVVADGTSCDDGNACNGAETCQSGVCVAGTPLSCPDDGACTVGVCDPASGCQSLPRSCDDGNPCTVDGCDAVAGCSHAAAPPTTECSDGLACNGVERCDGAGACVPGATCETTPPSHGAKSGCGSAGSSSAGGPGAALVVLALLAALRRRRTA